MAVQSSGADLTMQDLVSEFGGSAPHAISEYYGGGGLVPAGANPNVPTSGEVQFSDFYGSVAATVLTISSNTSDYNIKTAVVAAGGDQNTPVILTINSGVTISGSNASTPAMKTDTGWGSGNTINITNNGSIVGSAGSNTSGNPPSGGGAGGAGNVASHSKNGLPGSAGGAGSGSADYANNGGNAFEHSQTGDNNLQVTFDTTGTRTGGSAGTKTITGNGGGGGGGGANGAGWCAGGGGGGGANGGSGGARGNDALGNGGSGGSTGGSTTGGAGGSKGGTYCSVNLYSNNCGNVHHSSGGNGGAGGNIGNNGAGGSGGSGMNTCNNSFPGTGGGSGGSAGSNGSANGSAGSALSGNTGKIN